VFVFPVFRIVFFENRLLISDPFFQKNRSFFRIFWVFFLENTSKNLKTTPIFLKTGPVFLKNTPFFQKTTLVFLKIGVFFLKIP
jgi:hypothetical protein